MSSKTISRREFLAVATAAGVTTSVTAIRS